VSDRGRQPAGLLTDRWAPTINRRKNTMCTPTETDILPGESGMCPSLRYTVREGETAVSRY
jgi:hypothetical protein